MRWLDDIFYYIKTCSVWVRRIAYCRGFGIQSPSAYDFVCNVVNPHIAYDAYDALTRLMHHRGREFQKLGRLLYRISLFQLPDVAYVDDRDWKVYVRSGCEKCTVLMYDAERGVLEKGKKLWMLSASLMADGNTRDHVLDNCREGDILVAYGLRNTSMGKRLWADLVVDERSVVCYDLYYCGIVFFDKSKSKQQFRVNY